jgi:hypothetical protein
MKGNFNVYNTFALTRLVKKGHKIDFPEDLKKAKTKIHPKLKI